VTPFKDQKGEAYEGGYRVPAVIPWPGVIKPGTLFTEMFASLDWLPTFVEIAGGPKANDVKKQIELGAYPGVVKTTLDGVNQIDYLTGKSQKSAREVFYYFSGATPSAVRYKTWKMYYTMAQSGAEGGLDTASYTVPPDPGPKHQARSVRAGSRHQPEDGHESRRRTCRPLDRVPVRLEHATHRPAARARVVRDTQGVPASAGARELQPHAGDGPAQRGRARGRLARRGELDVTKRPPLPSEAAAWRFEQLASSISCHPCGEK